MIKLATIEERVVGEPGKVFSTDPQVAIGEDGKTYFIKGRNSPTAFCEVTGCLLAAGVGLRVPTATACSFDGELYGAVESVPGAQRNIRPWLGDLQRINNPTDLFSVIAVDTWLANDDRNMGNLVGSSLGDGRIDVFMIDFEKSRTLAQNPFTGSGQLDPKTLWPRGELGKILRSIQPRRCPERILETIKAISEQQIHEVVMRIAEELPFINWHSSSVDVLSRRSQNIARLVDAVWKKN